MSQLLYKKVVKANLLNTWEQTIFRLYRPPNQTSKERNDKTHQKGSATILCGSLLPVFNQNNTHKTTLLQPNVYKHEYKSQIQIKNPHPQPNPQYHAKMNPLAWNPTETLPTCWPSKHQKLPNNFKPSATNTKPLCWPNTNVSNTQPKKQKNKRQAIRNKSYLPIP